MATEDNVCKLAACPGCFHSSPGDQFFLPQMPVVLNYRCSSSAEARNVARRDIRLRECRHCGLIYNEVLDRMAISYDEGYENSQAHSPKFVETCRQTARNLAAGRVDEKSVVLEVGCGKGDFLKMLCDQFSCKGIGYDTSCEFSGVTAEGRVTFFQRYVTAEDIQENLDLIVCRHVVEHVPDIRDFLCLLRDLAVKGGQPVVYLETPAFEWIVDHQAFWDVFYEHCNYFTMPALRYLAESVGFKVLNHQRIFGGQYQSLELCVPSSTVVIPTGVAPGSEPLLLAFAQGVSSACHNLEENLRSAGAGRNWMIWGAGAKGVTLANTLTNLPPAFIIDSNPAKQGRFIPGTGTPVIAPSALRSHQPSLIYVANSNYLPEIRRTLEDMGLFPVLLSH
jgi:SAM-dependent methyltransferase